MDDHLVPSQQAVLFSTVSSCREDRGLSQQQLADLWDVSLTTVQNLEAGHGIAHFAKIDDLCKVLKCQLKDLAAPNPLDIGKRRQALGIRKEALAETLQVSKNTISNWEKGGIARQVEKQLSLCIHLDCSLQDLFVRKESSTYFVSAIKKVRETQKLSVPELARRANISTGILRSLEEEAGFESVRQVIRLCQALDCELDDLYEVVSTEDIQNKSVKRVPN